MCDILHSLPAYDTYCSAMEVMSDLPEVVTACPSA